MNISTNYNVAYCRNNDYKNAQNKLSLKAVNSNCTSFTGDTYMGHKVTDLTPWGTTWGEHRVEVEREKARKRAIQRETLRNSEDEWVRSEADNVGKDPVWDEYLTQREYDKYHEAEMKRRAENEARIRSNAGLKQCLNDGTYKICNEKGFTIEEGIGDKWTKRIEYFDESGYKDKKEIYPNGTWIHDFSYRFEDIGKEIGRPDGSVEYYKRCTGALAKITYPDGSYKEMQLPSYMYENPKEDAVKKEVKTDGTVVKYDLTNYKYKLSKPNQYEQVYLAKNYKTEENYPDGTKKTYKYDKAFNLREICERDGSVTKIDIDPMKSNNYIVVDRDSAESKETLPDGTIVKYDLIVSSDEFKTRKYHIGCSYYDRRYRTEEEYSDGTKRLYKYDDKFNLEKIIERDGSVTEVSKRN